MTPQQLLDRLEDVLEDAALLPAQERVRVLDVAVTRVQARQVDAIRQLGRDGTLDGSGCTSLGSWARLHLRRGLSAHRMARRAAVLPELPGFAAAFAAGEVTDEHVDTMIRWAKPCGLDVLRAHEDTLLELARAASARELDQALEAVADLVNPDRDAELVAALAGRLVTISKVGDLVHVDAMLEPALGEAVKTAVEAGAALPPGVRRVDDGRTLAQRRADAFGELLLAGIGDGRHRPGAADAHPRGYTGRLRPQVALTLSVDRLAGIGGAPPALLEHFGAVPAPTMHRLVCDAAIARVVLDAATGRPLDLGRSSLLAVKRQRRALATVFRRCAFPGCQVPFRFTEIHHVQWWCRDNGATDLALLVPYCWTHHHFLHEYGFTVHRDPDTGRLTHHRPDGAPIPDPDQPLRHAISQLTLDLHASHPPDPADTARTDEPEPPP